MEGEPASAKDRYLLSVAPHLVLDGLALAAAEVDADAVMMAVRRDRTDAVRSLERALAERHRAGLDRIEPSLHQGPPRYVGGEETALVHWLNGGTIRPTAVPPRPFQRGVSGRPTLVLNVETIAHIALLARYGDAWFRSVGLPRRPRQRADDGNRRPGTRRCRRGGDGIVSAGGRGRLRSAVAAGDGAGRRVLRRLAAVGVVRRAARRSAAAAGGRRRARRGHPDRRAGRRRASSPRRPGSSAYLARESAGQCGPCINGVAGGRP